MADDGEVVLAAERDVVLSLRVDPATAELIASVRFLAPRVRDPARDATLLAEQLGRFVRAVAAEAETRTARRNHPSAVAVHDGEVARAALLAAGAERAQIPNLRASSADDEVGAAALLATVAERARFRNLRPAATALLATVAERARFPNLRAAAVLAEDAERARLRNLQLVDAHEDDAAVSGRAHVRAAAAQEDVASVLGRDLRAALVVEVDAHGALRVVVNPSHVEAFDRGTLAVAVVPAARAEGLFRGDLLVASGGAAALFRAAANGVLRRDLLAAPVFVFVEPQVRGAARRHHVMLGAPNIIGADAGGSRSHRGIQVGGDDAHGPQIAVAEDRGFGGPTAVANRGGARGQQRSDRVVFRGSLSAAGARGEEVVFRGRITSLRHGLVVSLFPAMPAPTPLGTSSRAVATSTSRPRAAPKPKPTPATATKIIKVCGTRIKVSMTKKVPKRDCIKSIPKRNCNILMKFKAILSDFVWFAVPQVLLFYPRKVEGKEKDEQSKVSWVDLIHIKESIGLEKPIIMTLFVGFISIWVAAILLATFGKGRRCMCLVGALTYITVISVIGFIDYMLYKTLQENIMYEALFILHFLAMVCIISWIWTKYVREPKWELPNFKSTVHRIRSQRHHSQAKDPLLNPLLADDLV